MNYLIKERIIQHKSTLARQIPCQKKQNKTNKQTNKQKQTNKKHKQTKTIKNKNKQTNKNKKRSQNKKQKQNKTKKQTNKQTFGKYAHWRGKPMTLNAYMTNALPTIGHQMPYPLDIAYESIVHAHLITHEFQKYNIGYTYGYK